MSAINMYLNPVITAKDGWQMMIVAVSEQWALFNMLNLSDSEHIGSFVDDLTCLELANFRAYSQNYDHGGKEYLTVQ